MKVLSLFDYTGNMVKPWAEGGHESTIVDIEEHRDNTSGAICVQADIMTWEPDDHYDFIAAFPPCTHLASSGARWWKDKGESALTNAISLVRRTVEIIDAVNPHIWMIENPVGRLSSHWRPADYTFNPCDFGGYLNPPGDAYTKRTCLWTSQTFRMPEPRPVDPVHGSMMHRVAPGKNRQRIRSATPMGFAYAVYWANWITI